MGGALAVPGYLRQRPRLRPAKYFYFRCHTTSRTISTIARLSTCPSCAPRERSAYPAPISLASSGRSLVCGFWILISLSMVLLPIGSNTSKHLYLFYEQRGECINYPLHLMAVQLWVARCRMRKPRLFSKKTSIQTDDDDFGHRPGKRSGSPQLPKCSRIDLLRPPNPFHIFVFHCTHKSQLLCACDTASNPDKALSS